MKRHSTTNNIFNEICLRTDMMKFTFNHFLIRTRIHKFLPNLAFKKDSYYFTSLSPIRVEETDKIDNLEINLKKEKTNNCKNQSCSSKGLDSTFYNS